MSSLDVQALAALTQLNVLSVAPFSVIPPPSAVVLVGDATLPSSMFLSSTVRVVELIVVVVPLTTKSPAMVVVPPAAPIFNVVAAPAKFTVVDVVLNTFCVAVPIILPGKVNEPFVLNVKSTLEYVPIPGGLVATAYLVRITRSSSGSVCIILGTCNLPLANNVIDSLPAVISTLVNNACQVV